MKKKQPTKDQRIQCERAILKRIRDNPDESSTITAREVGCSRSTVNRIRAKHNQYTRRALGETKSERIRELGYRGFSVPQIVRKLGEEYHFVYSVLVKAGIHKPKPHKVRR